MRYEISIYVKAIMPYTPNDIESWHLLDTDKVNLTLDYVSNILSDAGSITSSRTFTVQLPRTVHNDKVLDMAVVPQYDSRSRYKYLSCRCYVNGIDVMGEAYLYLLDSDAAHYQCCIVFGLLQHYREWIDAGKSLKDLEDRKEFIQWDWQAAYTDGPHAGMPDPWVPIWYGDDPASYNAQNGLSRAMYYGIYNPGFPLTYENVVLANVHPFVTVRELWERIVQENNLNFTMPNDVLLDMEDLAIVLTKISGNKPVGVPTIHTTQLSSGHLIHRNPWSFMFWLNEQGYFDTATNAVNRVFSQGYKPVVLNINIVLENAPGYLGLSQLIYYVGGDMNRLRMRIMDAVTGEAHYLTPYNISTQSSQLYYTGQVTLEGSEVNGDLIGYLVCNIEPNNYIEDWVTVSEYLGKISAYGSVQYITYPNTCNFPNDFFLIPNLPDIKQVDFVKFFCQLYGLFPVVNPLNSEQIDFVPFDILIENRPKAYDWSDRLLEDDTDAPKKISFRLGDFARRNIIAYKEDEKDPVSEEIRSGVLFVDDLTLAHEKELFTFPFAATEDNTIHQYQIKTVTDNGTDPPTVTREVEFTECVHRLMRVVTWLDYINKTFTKLSFAGLTVPQIIDARYDTYQNCIRQPRLITERIRLAETELNSLDMRTPVYLAKYGSFFAIKDIKWTVGNDYADCELLMLIADVINTKKQ